MSSIARFAGIVVYVYADDHAPPHVHAYYGEYEVLLVIATADVYRGGFPLAQLRLVREWLKGNRAVTQAAWDRLNP